MLILGAGLMVLAGVVFLLTRNPLLLTAAAIIGVISPSGNEIGPFLSIEQAALTQLIPDKRRTHIFAWYNLAGSFATATGALAGGWLAKILQSSGWSALAFLPDNPDRLCHGGGAAHAPVFSPFPGSRSEARS